MKRAAKPGQMAQVEELQAFINECEPLSDESETPNKEEDLPTPPEDQTNMSSDKNEEKPVYKPNKRVQAVESDFSLEEDSILESRSKRRVVAFSDSDYCVCYKQFIVWLMKDPVYKVFYFLLLFVFLTTDSLLSQREFVAFR